MLEYLQYPNMYVREVMDTYAGKLRQSFGFRTDGLTRPVLIATLQEFVRNNVHLIHDKDTLDECLTFIRNEAGRAEAEQNEHDDLLMAYGIALMARGQQSLEVPEEKKKKKVEWTEDMWADYYAATSEEQDYLIRKWGDPF